MKLSEITPTYNSYSVLFSDDPGAETIPRIEIETRSGMFEYLFMWVDYPPQTIVAFPKTHPIIQSLEFKVRGRENLFVRKLNGDDIERLSRDNCHKLCNWREWHERGQGVLLRLGDLGLTEELAYPERKRIQLEISCLSKSSPEQTDNIPRPISAEFHVVVVRRNQLFRGDNTGTTFSFLNENR